MKLWQGGGLSIKPHCRKGKNDSLFWMSAQSKPSVSKLATKQKQRSISTVSSYFRFPKITQRPSTFSTTLSQKKVEERREDTYKWRINSSCEKFNWTVLIWLLKLDSAHAATSSAALGENAWAWFFKMLCYPMTPAASNQIKLDTWGRSRPPGPRSSLQGQSCFFLLFFFCHACWRADWPQQPIMGPTWPW